MTFELVSLTESEKLTLVTNCRNGKALRLQLKVFVYYKFSFTNPADLS